VNPGAKFSIWIFKYQIAFFGLFFFKSIIDFPFLLSSTKFFRSKKLIWWFIPAQFVYIFYVSSVFILSLFGDFSWKDRIHNA